MFYFYFIAHYYDVRHRYEDKMAIRVEADTLDEANVRAQKAALKVEIEYPYKRFRSLDLEQTIPAAVIAAEDEHSFSGLLEEV